MLSARPAGARPRPSPQNRHHEGAPLSCDRSFCLWSGGWVLGCYQRGSRLGRPDPRPPRPPPRGPRPKPPPGAPKPPPRSTFGRASFTLMARPCKSLPFNAAIAFCPSSDDISTNPNPRGLPVSRSVMIWMPCTSPNGSNSALTSASVALKGRLPTKILTITLQVLRYAGHSSGVSGHWLGHQSNGL